MIQDLKNDFKNDLCNTNILIIIIIIIELLGETRIIILLLIIIIISAGTPLVSNSFHFSWNPKYIQFWNQYILVSSES